MSLSVHPSVSFSEPPDSGDAQPHTIPILEYGKFADGNGRVEAMEHSVLASSPDWPADLLPYCGPRIVGRSLQDNDRLPPWAEHGTIMQPIATEGVSILWSRVRSIPEGRSNRPYQRARFVVSQVGTRPWQVFRAIDRPLEEFVRHRDENLVPIPLFPPPVASAALQAFANETLLYLLAGIPVAVAGEISESDFFLLVDTLWSVLPSPLRKVFSAGWGMGISQQGRLSFSAGMTACAEAALCVRFANGDWQIQAPAVASEAVTSGLGLARLFLKLIDVIPPSVQSADSRRLAAAERLLYTRKSPPRGLLSANLPWVKEHWRSTGYAAYDIWRVEGALRPPERDVAVPDASTLLKDLWFAESFTMAVEATISQLVEGNTASAMERLASWLHQEPSRTATAIAAWMGIGRSDAIHLRRLLDQPAQDVLEELSGEDAITEPWSPIAEYSAIRVLVRSLPALNLRELALHDRLLRSPRIAIPYAGFLQLGAWDLFLRADELSVHETGDRISWLRRHGMASSPAFEALAQLARLDAGPPETLLHSLSEDELRSLSECVVRRFTTLHRESRKRKDSWLAWALMLVPRKKMVLVDIAAAEIQSLLSPAESNSIREAVVCGSVPPEAARPLAAAIQRNLSLFLSDLFKSPSAWRWLNQHWPMDLSSLLGLSEEPARSLPVEILELPYADLDIVFRFWADPSLNRGRRCMEAAAALLLNDCRSMSNHSLSSAPLVWLCTDITRDRAYYITNGLLPGHPVVDGELIVLAATLFRRLPQQHYQWLLPPTPEHKLWQQADSGLALLLLLLLYPESRFDVQKRHITLLSTERKSLKEALDLKSENPGVRLAGASFHTLDYESSYSQFPTARPELWAAFRGMPIKKQGDLMTALLHYGATLSERVTLCHTYLSSACIKDREKTAEKAMKEFVMPLLNRYFLPKEVQQLLEAAYTGVDVDVLIQRLNRAQQNFTLDASFIRLIQTTQRMPTDSGAHV